jgi:hypothetical protein
MLQSFGAKFPCTGIKVITPTLCLVNIWPINCNFIAFIFQLCFVLKTVVLVLNTRLKILDPPLHVIRALSSLEIGSCGCSVRCHVILGSDAGVLVCSKCDTLLFRAVISHGLCWFGRPIASIPLFYIFRNLTGLFGSVAIHWLAGGYPLFWWLPPVWFKGCRG